jgi:plasmid stability protein
MATLYVENIPEELYEALRERARQHRKSIAAEILTLLEKNIPTAAELKKRQKIFKQLERLRSSNSAGPGPFPTSEQMQREDRER